MAYPMIERACMLEIPRPKNGRPSYVWVQGWKVRYSADRESMPLRLADARALLAEERSKTAVRAIHGRQCAKLDILTQIKDVTEDDAMRVRAAWHGIKNRHDAREEVNRIIQTHGIEYLGQMKRTGEHVYYCNAGDPYSTTVLFTGLRLWVGCWSDLIEANRIKENNSQY